MSNIVLSEARVKALVLRKSTYDIRDATHRGFGVRILPSGTRRFFIHIQHRGRIWKTVGDTTAMTLNEARTGAARQSPVSFGTRGLSSGAGPCLIEGHGGGKAQGRNDRSHLAQGLGAIRIHVP